MKYLGRIALVSAVLLVILCSYVPAGMSYSSSVTATGTINCTFNTGDDITNNNSSSSSVFEFDVEDGDDAETDVIKVTPSSGVESEVIAEVFNISFQPHNGAFYISITLIPYEGKEAAGQTVTVRIVTDSGTIDLPELKNSSKNPITYNICMIKNGQNSNLGYTTNNPVEDNNCILLDNTHISSVNLSGGNGQQFAPTVKISVIYPHNN